MERRDAGKEGWHPSHVAGYCHIVLVCTDSFGLQFVVGSWLFKFIVIVDDNDDTKRRKNRNGRNF